MAIHKVGYLIGSLAQASINRKLAKALVQLAPPELEMTEIGFKDLPLYSYDYDANFPPAAQAFKKAIASVQAVLFVTPEYNRSIPGGLKNAIDWASRPLRQKFIRAQTVGRHWNIAGRHRDRCRPTKPAQRAEFLQLTADECTRSLYPVHAGTDHG